jgi:hypothetical protein
MSIMLNWTTKHSCKPAVIIIKWKPSLYQPRGLWGRESRDTRFLYSDTRGLLTTEHTPKWAPGPVWAFLERGKPVCLPGVKTTISRSSNPQPLHYTNWAILLTPHSVITLHGMVHNRHLRFVKDFSHLTPAE